MRLTTTITTSTIRSLNNSCTTLRLCRDKIYCAKRVFRGLFCPPRSREISSLSRLNGVTVGPTIAVSRLQVLYPDMNRGVKLYKNALRVQSSIQMTHSPSTTATGTTKPPAASNHNHNSGCNSHHPSHLIVDKVFPVTVIIHFGIIFRFDGQPPPLPRGVEINYKLIGVRFLPSPVHTYVELEQGIDRPPGVWYEYVLHSYVDLIARLLQTNTYVPYISRLPIYFKK